MSQTARRFVSPDEQLAWDPPLTPWFFDEQGFQLDEDDLERIGIEWEENEDGVFIVSPHPITMRGDGEATNVPPNTRTRLPDWCNGNLAVIVGDNAPFTYRP